MQVDWTYDGCDEHDVPAIGRYWERVQSELEGKLAELSHPASELRIAVERGESNPAWEIQAALHLPGHTLVASGVARRPESAVDKVLHGLAERIDALEGTPARVTHRREGLEGIVELLQAWRVQNRSQAFLSFLAPLVRWLGPYIQHELSISESEGSLVGEEIDTSDVLDEVMLQAWQEFDRRDPAQAFDLWLVQLADEALGRLTRKVGDASLDEPCSAPETDLPPFDGEAWIEQVSYPETIEISELLSDGPGVETWDDLDMETKQTHLADVLGNLERDLRQAFVLNVAHGFSPAEIADFQSRSVDDVQHDIARATSAVRRYFIDEQTADQEEAFARADMRRRRKRR